VLSKKQQTGASPPEAAAKAVELEKSIQAWLAQSCVGRTLALWLLKTPKFEKVALTKT
jgi:hypothetical protein